MKLWENARAMKDQAWKPTSTKRRRRTAVGPTGWTTVADIMRPDVIAVTADTTVGELASLFLAEGISGAPVVDADGRPIGVISSTDVLWRGNVNEASGLRPRSVSASLRQLARTRVSQIMTPDVFGLPPTATLPELRRFFRRTGSHRALVLDGGAIVGIVSISDYLRLVADQALEPGAAEGTA